MLLIPAHLAPSPIHGIGCFTDHDIKQGELVWVYDDRIDRRIPAAELADFPAPTQAFLTMYAYEEIVDGQRVLTLCGDHAKHMNHADKPNLLEGADGSNLAACDIAASEELTCDYSSFDLSTKF